MAFSLSACGGGPNHYLEALERDHPVLSDFAPEMAIRTDRSTRGGTGIQANGQRNATVSQRYIPVNGDQSRAAVLGLMTEFEALLEADGWILSQYEHLYASDGEVGLRGHQGGKRRVTMLVLEQQSGGEEYYLSVSLQDRP